MNFDLNVEQRMLKESAREFFSKEVDGAAVRRMEEDEKGYCPKLWGKMARLGWMGLLVPQACGGEGAELLDMAMVLEEIGYAAVPGPFFASAVVSALILREAGSENQKKKLLPELASGKKIVTSAWSEEKTALSAAGISAWAVRQDSHYAISGTKWFVPYAHVSDYIITALRTGEAGDDGTGGISLFLIDRKLDGVCVDPLRTSSADKFCEVRFDQVRVPAENLLGELNQGWKVLKAVFCQAAVAKCAEMIGGGDRVLKLTVDYAKKREQFGRPIGSFQAIQHHCANMKTYLDTSVLMTYQACWRIGQKDGWEKEAAMCKAWVGDSLKKVAALGHQVMGGFGFMEEADHQLHTRRFRTAELQFGDASYHRELVAGKMGL